MSPPGDATANVATPAPRTPRAERRRSRILEAAGHCFARQGFAKTTVEEIAAAAGVSKGLVYTYFEGKDALLDAVLSQALEEWGEATEAGTPASEAGAAARLAARHRAMLEFARSNPVLGSILSRDERVLLVGHERAFEEAVERWREALIESIEEGIAAGELAADLDVERTADVIRVLYGSIIERFFDGGPVNVTDDAFLDAAGRLLLRGILPPEADGASS